MSNLKVNAINHVVLHVTDLRRSLEFYQGILGFTERFSGREGMSFLGCGEQGLDLFEVSGEVYGAREMNHMALEVAAEELDQIIAELELIGVDVAEVTPRNSVFVLDPDGHRLELLPASALVRTSERSLTQQSL